MTLVPSQNEGLFTSLKYKILNIYSSQRWSWLIYVFSYLHCSPFNLVFFCSFQRWYLIVTCLNLSKGSDIPRLMACLLKQKPIPRVAKHTPAGHSAPWENKHDFLISSRIAGWWREHTDCFLPFLVLTMPVSLPGIPLGVLVLLCPFRILYAKSVNSKILTQQESTWKHLFFLPV